MIVPTRENPGGHDFVARPTDTSGHGHKIVLHDPDGLLKCLGSDHTADSFKSTGLLAEAAEAVIDHTTEQFAGAVRSAIDRTGLERRPLTTIEMKTITAELRGS